MCNTHPGWLIDSTSSRFAAGLTASKVAKSLAKICRFGGQVPQWYSVATHSVLVMSLVRQCWRSDDDVPDNAFRLALLHDAHEIFTGDITRPVLQQLPSVKTVQRRLDYEIFTAFNIEGFEAKAASAVQLADDLACQIELQLLGEPEETIRAQRPDLTDLSVGLLTFRGNYGTDAALWLRHWHQLSEESPGRL